jgi:hypothetical protein
MLKHLVNMIIFKAISLNWRYRYNRVRHQQLLKHALIYVNMIAK